MAMLLEECVVLATDCDALTCSSCLASTTTFAAFSSSLTGKNHIDPISQHRTRKKATGFTEGSLSDTPWVCVCVLPLVATAFSRPVAITAFILRISFSAVSNLAACSPSCSRNSRYLRTDRNGEEEATS